MVWDNLSVRLRPEDFLRIAEDTTLKAQSWLTPEAQQGFWLKLKDVAVRFEPEGLAVLRDLMCLAILNIEGATPATQFSAHFSGQASIN
jgi:hypothetical protein